MTAALVVLIAAVAGIGAMLAYVRRTPGKDPDGDARRQPLSREIAELTAKLKETQTELARKRELAEQIPLIISKLAQEIPENLLAPLAVRFARNYFHARQVGFFVPADGTTDYTLDVGVGFPADWRGKVRLSSDEGMLGLAVRNKVVVAGCDPLPSPGDGPRGLSLERAGAPPDFVAPVIGISGVAGVVVIAGCPFPCEEERIYVSMLADLLSGALQKAALTELSKSSTWVDPLTGVANRLYFTRRFDSEIRRAHNYRQVLGLLMLDIDGFKAVNDTYGHVAGDLAIRKFAETVRRITRSSDLVCRYGGDEFIILVTSSNSGQVLAYADLLKREIAAMEIPLPRHETTIRLTASGGVAMFPADGRSTTDLIHAADDALYEAKRQGRDRIVLAQSMRREGAAAPGDQSKPKTAAPRDGEPTAAPAAEDPGSDPGTDGGPAREAIND